MRKKVIEISDWQGRLQTFTSGNRGRTGAIVVGTLTLVEIKALISVNYDPVGKGNDMSLSLEGYTHVIDGPEKMFVIEDHNGVVKTLEIVDNKGVTTQLNLS